METCEELQRLFEEEKNNQNGNRVFGKISETEFKYFKCRYFETFKNTDLSTIYFHVDHHQFNSVLNSHADYRYMYIYFANINNERKLIFNFSDIDYTTSSTVEEATFMHFDEIYYLLENDRLVSYNPQSFRSDVTNYVNTFNETYKKNTGSSEMITVFIQNLMVDKFDFPHYVTFHLLLNESSKITIGTQINDDKAGIINSLYLNRGLEWP